jgi:D-alanyl-D-alanine endopeptidase (penicillin-binding protein 7)
MADANRLKRWLETGQVTAVPPAAISYRQQKLAQRKAAAQ